MPKIDWKWFDSPTHVALFLGGLLIAVGGAIAYLVLVPAETRTDVQSWLGPLLLVLMSGGGATSVATVLAGRASSRGPTRVSSTPPTGRDGFATVDSLGAVLLLVAGGCLLSLLLHGCGAGALVAQGRAATIVGVGLGSVAQEVHDERAAQLDACTDEGCLDAGERIWAPAVAAVESARTALATWIDSLAVATQAGAEDGDVIGALLVAVSHFVREWNDLAAAIRALNDPNLQPPDLPPVVTALLGAIGGAS